MKAIVFLETVIYGTNREAMRTAERLGYTTVLFTSHLDYIRNRNDFPEVDIMIYLKSLRFHPLKNRIKKLQSQGLEIAAIVSFMEFYTYTACLLADEFKINRFTTSAYHLMCNKMESRNLLASSPYCPFFCIIANSDPESLHLLKERLPLVVKLPQSAGSRDVYKVTRPYQLASLITKLSPKPDHPVIVEEYLDGPQYLVEAVVEGGEVHIVALIRQEVGFNRRFIITGYSMILDRTSDFYISAEKAVKSIIGLHGLKNGSCHLEIRYVNGTWKLIEINSRMARTNGMIQSAYGIDLVEETLKMWLGLKPVFEPKCQRHIFTQYVTITERGRCKDILGAAEAERCPGVLEVFVKPVKGFLLIPYSMNHRYAYVTATGNTEEEARSNAKSAASLIRFVM